MLNNLFNRITSRFGATKKLLLGSSFLLALAFNAQRCEAQYWGLGSGYGYYGLGSSLLWPLNSLMYSTGNSYAYGLGWPLYSLTHMGNRAYNNTAANSYSNIPYNNSSNSPYANNYSTNNASNNNYPFNYNNSAPVWNYQNSQSSINAQRQPFNDPNDIFNSGYPTPGLIPTTPNQKSIPTPAPDRHSLNAINNETPPALVANAAVSDGFFQTVNRRYKGNLIHALSQNDMRSWAESVGLIDVNAQISKGISQNRKNQITSIVKDSSLSSAKKLEILHLLLNSQ